MPKTVTLPVHHTGMWRKVLKRCHPDAGGEEDLFIWINNVREWVFDDRVEEAPREVRREPPRHYPQQTERVPFEAAFQRFPDHESLVRYAIDLASTLEEPYSHLLLLLSDLYPAAPGDTTLERAERAGASFKQLAFVGHLIGLNATQRQRLYRIAESIPLSQRCAGHLIARLKHEAA